MITYFLKSFVCLALLLAFYNLVLEREKMHQFNRFYLLGSIVFSFIAPLYKIYKEATQTIVEVMQPVVLDNAPMIEITEPIKEVNYLQYVYIPYLIVSLILTIRFIKNLLAIYLKTKQHQKIKKGKATLVLVDDLISPHTFWNYIFINKDEYNSNKIETELYTHELTHALQKHTFDILLIELLQIIFWINPTYILLKKAIKLNHEFLADNNVITTHKNTSEYQYLLLNRTTWNNEYYLASNLNYLLTKKRLLMMTKQSSRTNILFKKLAVIPVLAGFTFLFAERVEAQQKEVETIYEQPENVQGEKINSDLYKVFYYKNGFIVTKDKNGKKIKKKYSDLSDAEKRKLPPPPSIESEKKVPTKKIINDLKNNSKYAIWIDGKVANNSILNNYKNSDFSDYFISFVHKDARSKRFPQKYQASLLTNNYFKLQNKKRVLEFKNYLEKKHDLEEVVENSGNKFIDSPINKRKNSKQSMPSEFILDDVNEKLEDVNALKLSIIKQDTFTSKLPNGENIRIWEDKVSDYLELYKTYETLRTQKPHYIKSSDKRKELLNNMSSKLGSLYFKLSKTDKQKVKRAKNPKHPYIKLKKNNKVYYKLWNDLSEDERKLLPPPPPASKHKKKWKDVKYFTNDTIPSKPKTGFINLKNQKIYYVKNEKGSTYYNHWGQQVTEKGQVISKEDKFKKSNTIIIGSSTTNKNGQEKGWKHIGNQTLYYVKNKKGITYYNRWGQQVTKEGKVINPEQASSNKVIPGQNITKVYKNSKVVAEFKRTNLPPPPPPKTNFPEVKKGEKSNIPPPSKKKTKNNWVIGNEVYIIEDVNTKTLSSNKKNNISSLSKAKKENKWFVEDEGYIIEDINTKTGAIYKRKDIIKKPTSNEHTEFIKLDEKLKKNYFIEDKRTTKKEFYKHLKNNKEYHFCSAYTNKEKSAINMYISKSESRIIELMKKGY